VPATKLAKTAVILKDTKYIETWVIHQYLGLCLQLPHVDNETENGRHMVFARNVHSVH
jgi:hypothetical protein